MMVGESAFRPYLKPIVAHTAAGYEAQTAVSTPSHIYSSPEPVASSSPGKEKTRRRRTTFTPDQTAALEREYVTDRYMDSSKRAHLAESLGLNEVQVKTWFQNRRAKDKKEGRREEKLTYSNPAKSDSSSSTTPPIGQDLLPIIQENPTASMEAQPVPQIPAPVISTTLSSPALKAALESPVSVSTDCSPKENSPETPLSTNGNALSDSSVAAFNAVPSTTAPIPTSYADYLSLGLNPAMSIPAPVPYGSIYDIYGNYQQDYSGFLPVQAPTNPFFAALSTLDPQALTQQPLAHL